MTVTSSAAAADAAVSVAAGFGISRTRPVILADGANVIIHLSPSPVVAKVAARTTEVRPDAAAWLQRELDIVSFLTGAGAPVMAPSPEVPVAVHRADGQVVLHATAPRPGEQIPLRGGPLVEIVTVSEPTAHLVTAVELYGPRIRALQVVHADDRGRWPWEVGYRGVRGGQPVLGKRATLPASAA
jgi:hypothetical protein